jgi:hypothetical protein
VSALDLPAIVARARALRPLKDAVNVHRPLLLSTLTAATASAADVPALVAEIEAWRSAFRDYEETGCTDTFEALRTLLPLPTKGPTRAR